VDEDGEGGSETTATIPLGSDIGSDSELTDEEDEDGQEVLTGLPVASGDPGATVESSNVGNGRIEGTPISAQNS
jgi:hypothetical protein